MEHLGYVIPKNVVRSAILAENKKSFKQEKQSKKNTPGDSK